ncbi:MAG: 50S ribosomal protein L5 [Planctomycetota bacterium]|nr:50S ribosomal protein L5 [Planctomycetota bacterium]
MAKETDKQAQGGEGKKGPPPGKGPQGKGAPGRAAGGKKPGPAKHEAHDAPEDTGPRVPARLKVAFEEKVRPAFAEKFAETNRMAQPRLEKIVLNVNMGRHLEGTKIPPHIRAQVIDTLTRVTGQKPVVVKARKSVSNFKLRAGFEASAMVTIRRDRMWHFLDRLINLATPRIKDFRGLNDKAFDRQGNYSMGLTEQGVFPEINMAEAQFTHGMHINMCFRNSTPERSRFVLEQLGMPFRKPEQR